MPNTTSAADARTTLEALSVPASWAGGRTLRSGAVHAVSITEAPASRLGADGYGTTGTRYAVRLADGRTRRVYAHALGNGATLTVRVQGVDVHLDIATEYRLEVLRDRGTDPGIAAARAVLGMAADSAD